MLFLFLICLIAMVVCIILPFATAAASLEEVLPFISLFGFLSVVFATQAIRRRGRGEARPRRPGSRLLTAGAIVALAGVLGTILSVLVTLNIHSDETNAERRLANANTELAKLENASNAARKQYEDDKYYAEAALEDAQSLLPFGLIAIVISFAAFGAGLLMTLFGIQRKKRRHYH